MLVFFPHYCLYLYKIYLKISITFLFHFKKPSFLALLLFVYRLRDHCSTVGWGPSVLYALLRLRDSSHLPAALQHHPCPGAQSESCFHTPPAHLLGSVSRQGCAGLLWDISRVHSDTVLPAACCQSLSVGERLELSRGILLLLHFAQYHRVGRLSARTNTQSGCAASTGIRHFLWVQEGYCSVAMVYSKSCWLRSQFTPDIQNTVYCHAPIHIHRMSHII